jgi:DNA-binding transcriptional ArsR family regulator
MSKRNLLTHALNHPTRRRIIEALWHGGEPLSPRCFYDEYVDDSRISLESATYHFRQLAKDGITKMDGEEQAEGFERVCFILNGPNSSAAIRQMQLTH